MNQVNHKKQSIIITTFLFLVMFFMLFLFKYNTQKIVTNLDNGGGGGDIAVNFGDSETGFGDNVESMDLNQQSQKVVSDPVPDEASEAVLTNTSEEDVPVVANTAKPKETPKVPIEKIIEKPKPSKATTDALSNLLNNSNTNNGDGNDNNAGNKGKLTGDPKAIGYNGAGGNGGGTGGGSGQGIGNGDGYGASVGSSNGNWKLSGRKLKSSSKQVQKCNEYGIVVVQITVNKSGNVIATKYAKGTTNTNICLLEPAYATAKSYRWQPDSDAPETQIGFITINFKQSE